MDKWVLIISIFLGLAGFPALWAVIIDVLKYFGVVIDGTAGKWSAAFNLLTLITVAVLIQFFPQLDVTKIDNTLLEIAKFAALVASFLFQIFVTNRVHRTVPVFTFTKG